MGKLHTVIHEISLISLKCSEISSLLYVIILILVVF